MFDFEKISRDIYDRIDIYFDVENDPIYSPKFKKRLRWIGYTAIPTFLNIVSIVMLFYIFFRIYNNSGFEKTVVILLLIIILSIRGLKKKPSI